MSVSMAKTIEDTHIAEALRCLVKFGGRASRREWTSAEWASAYDTYGVERYIVAIVPTRAFELPESVLSRLDDLGDRGWSPDPEFRQVTVGEPGSVRSPGSGPDDAVPFPPKIRVKPYVRIASSAWAPSMDDAMATDWCWWPPR